MQTVASALAGHGGVCMPASALLKEALASHGVLSTLQKGYLLIPEDQMAFRHVWVDADGLVLDIGTRVAITTAQMGGVSEGYTADSFRVSTDIPSGYELASADQDDVLPVWDLYHSDASQFWSGAPQRLQRIRAQLLGYTGRRAL